MLEKEKQNADSQLSASALELVIAGGRRAMQLVEEGMEGSHQAHPP